MGDSRSTGVPGASRPAIDADDAAIIGLRCHVVRLGAEKRGSAGGQPRFRLRDVGARHLADIEAVAGLLELLGEHLDVAAIEIEDRGIAQQIHVSGCGIEQNLLLGDAQRLARGIDLAFGLPGAVGGLVAVEQRVCAGGADGTRIECLRRTVCSSAGRRPEIAEPHCCNCSRRRR